MDREQSWRVIEQERLRLADLLEPLADDEWDSPSLCADWRIRDVAAHVALAPRPPGLADMLTAGLRARGRFHRLNHDISVRHANSCTGTALVTELRDHAASRRLPVVTTYRNIVIDILVHAQDIAIPLNRRHPMPTDAAKAAATRVWTMGWPFWARHRLADFRLHATDVEWTVGTGPHEIHGPIDALLLLLTGRTATMHRITGPGTTALTMHLNSRRRGRPFGRARLGRQ